MQLRIHPCMSHGGTSNWPPVWSRVSGGGEIPVGEVGTLEISYPSEVTDTKCFLIIQHDGSRFLGTLVFDDSPCRRKICEFLSRHCGQQLRTVAELNPDND